MMQVRQQPLPSPLEVAEIVDLLRTLEVGGLEVSGVAPPSSALRPTSSDAKGRDAAGRPERASRHADALVRMGWLVPVRAATGGAHEAPTRERSAWLWSLPQLGQLVRNLEGLRVEVHWKWGRVPADGGACGLRLVGAAEFRNLD